MEKINFDIETRYLPYAENLKRAFYGGAGAFLFFFVALPPAVVILLPGLAATPWFVAAVSLFSQLGLGVSTLAFLSGGRNPAAMLELNGWKNEYLKTGAMWGIVMLLIVAGIQGSFVQVGEWFGFDMKTPGAIEQLILRMGWGGVIWLAITAILVAPVVEEIFFRRVMFGFLANWCSWKPAMVITSLGFALIHADFRQLPGLFVLGMGFQLICLRSGSLYPAIIMHAVNNFIAMTLLILAKYFQIGGL